MSNILEQTVIVISFGYIFIVDGTLSQDLGKPIYMRQNSRWEYVDQDYTPYKNMLSAVWPTLRHSSFNWAVLDASNILDASTYYLQENRLALSDPCSHPESVKCGTTGK